MSTRLTIGQSFIRNPDGSLLVVPSSISEGFGVVVPSTTLSLTTFAPKLIADFEPVIPSASLNLTTYAPTLVADVPTLQELYESATVWLKFQEVNTGNGQIAVNSGIGGATYNHTYLKGNTARQSPPDINSISDIIDYSLGVTKVAGGPGATIGTTTFNLGAENHTLALYIKYTSTPTDPINFCIFGNRSRKHTIVLRADDNDFQNRAENGSGQTATQTVVNNFFEDNLWHRIVMHVQWGVSARVWVDGVLEGTLNLSSIPAAAWGGNNWDWGSGFFDDFKGNIASAAAWVGADDTLTDIDRKNL